MELTEFEKKLKFLLSAFQHVDSSSDDVINGVIQDYAKDLLDLARKELFKEQEHCVVIPEEDYCEQLASQYHIGQEDALKSLPKWKKITEEKQNYLVYGYLSNDEYYLSIQELKDKLPKEE